VIAGSQPFKPTGLPTVYVAVGKTPRPQPSRSAACEGLRQNSGRLSATSKIRPHHSLEAAGTTSRAGGWRFRALGVHLTQVAAVLRSAPSTAGPRR
jgi:hypothetical protein